MIQTPFKLTKEEILASAAATLLLLRLHRSGTQSRELSNVCKKPQYGFTASASWQPTGPRFVRITDIKAGAIDWDQVPYCQCSDAAPYALNKGDILVARSGSVGKSFLVSSVPEPAVFASYMIRLRATANTRPDYIYWCLQSQQFWQQIMNERRGSAMKNINSQMLAALCFPWPEAPVQEAIITFLNAFRRRLDREKEDLPDLPPPLDEQRRIVASIEELSAKIEEARRLRERTIKEAEIFGDSALSKIFDIAPVDALPSGWHWEQLPDLLVNDKTGMITGPFGTLLQKSDIQDSGIPVLGIANVQANRFVLGFTDYITHQKAESLSVYRLCEEDIVIARSGTVGRACLVPGRLDPMPIMSTNLIRLRLNQKRFLPGLLCMLFNGSRLIENHKDSECRGSSRTFFTQKILSHLRLPVPPLPEQHRIVAYLDGLQVKVGSLKKLQGDSAAELDALMPSILSRAFKGEF